jgi:arylsulfatase A-like enzyme
VNGNDNWGANDIAGLAEQFSAFEWNPPDAGTEIGASLYDLSTLGGGIPNNDGRYVAGPSGAAGDDRGQTPGFGQSVLEFLADVGSTPPSERQPFCLFVSLVNPHDVGFFPNGWEEGGYDLADFADLGIELPPNFDDDLSTKPSVQLRFREAVQQRATLVDDVARLHYVNFYAYLHTVVDRHIMAVLDALDEHGLTEDTIVIRTADHGELGLSHGLREKSYTAYEECIHVPLVVSNPRMYPFPVSTRSFYSHVDLLPTIAELAGVADPLPGLGRSVVPVLRQPSASVRDAVLFTYDDMFDLSYLVPGGRVRALRTGDWSYAVSFSVDGSCFEYELYDLARDPLQLDNLAFGTPLPAIAARWNALHAELTQAIAAADAFPDDQVGWPERPADVGWVCPG